jgi:hypothetical protein
MNGGFRSWPEPPHAHTFAHCSRNARQPKKMNNVASRVISSIGLVCRLRHKGLRNNDVVELTVLHCTSLPACTSSHAARHFFFACSCNGEGWQTSVRAGKAESK